MNHYGIRLVDLWRESLKAVHPERLLLDRRFQPRDQSAVLCWGKAAISTWNVLKNGSGRPHLVISTSEGDHPVPGNKSLEMGGRLLGFFDYLNRIHCRRLDVYLSGGASSLAWVSPPELSLSRLQTTLRRLHEAGLSIDELNRRRSRLCGLKGGGAARWARTLAPGLDIRVHVISDVLPFGMDVVGSGPFSIETGARPVTPANKRIPHVLMASNADWVDEISRLARLKGLSVRSKAGWVAPWTEWLEKIHLPRAPGLLVLGGEATVRLPPGCPNGGRLTHLAAVLLDRFWNELLSGQIEILCASSDGVDGSSGAAAVHLSGLPRGLARNAIRGAIRTFRAAELLRDAGALVPACETGTNVQDVLLIL